MIDMMNMCENKRWKLDVLFSNVKVKSAHKQTFHKNLELSSNDFRQRIFLAHTNNVENIFNLIQNIVQHKQVLQALQLKTSFPTHVPFMHTINPASMCFSLISRI